MYELRRHFGLMRANINFHVMYLGEHAHAIEVNEGRAPVIYR